MKVIIKILLLYCTVLLSLNCNCTEAMIHGDLHPPYPRVASIIPMGYQNSWLFSHTHYNEAGIVEGRDQALDAAIPMVYGLTDDFRLVSLVDTFVHMPFTDTVFKYEWRKDNQGLLISYLDNSVDTPGVYIRGKYNNDWDTLYEPPILWLVYPLKSITTWTITDTNITNGVPMAMELLSSDTLFNTAEQGSGSMSAVPFYSCYLYKETQGDSISYHFYNSTIGQAGYLMYVNQVLRRSFILRKFTEGY